MKLTKQEINMLGLSNDINVKFIENKESFFIYKIIYSYETVRKNKKENFKYVPAKSWENAFKAFFNHIDNFNENNEYRKISNVEILDFYDVGSIER